jgi:hypothetical protein
MHFPLRNMYHMPQPSHTSDFISQIIFHAEYNHKGPCYAKSSGLLLPHPSLVMVQFTARPMALLHNGTTLKKTVWSKW